MPAEPLGAADLTCQHCGAPVADLDGECPSCGESQAAIEPTVVKAGAEVLEGKWAIEERIGKGGMGTVFLATDLTLDRKVAIKMLTSAFSQDPEVIARFEREAKMMAKLDHPNLVPIYAVGRKDGVPFIVMKYLEGANLSDHIRQAGRLEMPEVLGIIRQVCSALSFVHSRGFIHRDIKPANIFVAPDGHVTILDLGVAHDPKSNVTRSGLLIGTPKYMSPEQVLGQKLDHRSDLYALGTVLFEMATGAPVFDGESDFSVMRAHTDVPPPDPSTQAGLPKPVSVVIQKTLAKKPDDRFQSAAELYQALEAGTLPGASPILLTAAVPTNTVLARASRTPAPGSVSSPGKRDGPVSGTKLTPLDPEVPAPRQAATPAPVAAPSPAVTRPEVAAALPRSRSGLLFLAAAAVVLMTFAAAGYLILRPYPAEEVPEPSAAGDTSAAAVEPPPQAEPAPPAEPALPAEPAPPAGSSPPEPSGSGRIIELAEAADAPTAAKIAPPEPRAQGGTKQVERARASDPDKSKRSDPKRPGQIRVTAIVQGQPSWAWVNIDGTRKGSAPIKIDVEPGKHVVQLERQGFKTVVREVSVAPGEVKKIPVELAP
ncbi:MAG: serine/threonine protein kinase [Myxococcales bacterium]|nr:serine/threonine protein kinase [Myxococcales bacterium]